MFAPISPRSPAAARFSRTAPALLGLAAAIAFGAFAGSAEAAAPVPCGAIGGGKYNCQFYPAGDGLSGGTPVLSSAGARVGYLNQHTNWVICQQAGRTEHSGAYYNKWWAYTQANDQQWGWASAVYASGGDNDGPFGGGVPNCNGQKGLAPGGVASKPGQPPKPGETAPPPLSPSQPTTCASTPGAGSNVTRWAPVVRCVLGMLGQPQSDVLVEDTFIIIEHESGGDPNAINNYDSNAQRGQASQGLMQVIPDTFAFKRSPNLPNRLVDPAANIYAGLNWGIYKYGSIANIPGVKSIRAGGHYKPYAAQQVKGIPKATSCATTHTAGLTLSVNGHGQSCSKARRAAAALDRQGAIRHARTATPDLLLNVGSRPYVCVVDPTRHGRALRAVSCQSGRRTLWWAASRTRRH